MTPQLGKRKRGSPNAQPDAAVGEEDELSPDRDEVARSAEKARRVVGTASPMQQEQDNGPDELSVLDEGTSSVRETVFARSTVMKRTPPQATVQQRASPGSVTQHTPTAGANGATSARSRRSTSRRSKSTDPVPATPSLLPSGQPRKSLATRNKTSPNTPAAAPTEAGSEDELSPQAAVATPRVVGSQMPSQQTPQEETDMAIDELSPQVEPTQISPTRSEPTITQTPNEDSMEQVSAPQSIKRARGRPRRVIEEDVEEGTPIAASAKHTSPRRNEETRVQESEAQDTPVTRKPTQKKKKKQGSMGETADGEVDGVSPAHGEAQRAKQKTTVETWSTREASADDEDPAPEEDDQVEPAPRAVAKRCSPTLAQRVKPSTEKPPRKRQKYTGPTHTISVMRIKGSTVRGITAADITRSILEENIDHRLRRMAGKLQNAQDADRRKELRSEINLSITFKESLSEKLMDLQDANDVLSSNFHKMKLLRRANADVRKEMLALQNSRQEIALEQDDIQTQYHAEKAEVDRRNQLSDSMFAIEAAVKKGREKARKEGREEEGPDLPLSMLLEKVAGAVGSRSGGLLANVKGFNGLLERAAGWLEGRA